ncbi:GNAT family N-acetyltransferase [Neobacillus sp. SuZ13]|uniref:GNAT family N-acetyltransferase n=1 Tax=Neobacillus sp. SuZ13 TaxID=3047875 RepID=UPI0024BF4F45|nr:GNAT family N-acetyltransferase [Neobacillus sp. SuZ13]WHY69268.1 GNAT family N-acetyltransferase [Neobacillus sp. SuZ13]
MEDNRILKESMNINFKKLTECTIQDIITAWNRGFEGYFVKLEMTAEMFFNRLVNEGLSLEHSLVAYDGDKPVAIVLNGFRVIEGKKTSWNGGTGIAPEYRGKGVSRLLMEAALNVYAEEGVEVATLEAIKENERAIRLYQRFGYEITDSLVYLSGKVDLKDTPISHKSIRPEQLHTYHFYKENLPWQCQWQSVKSGEAQIYFDENQNPLGYSLFKRVWNQEGQLEKVLLYQLEIFAELKEGTIKSILSSITRANQNPINFMTINSSLSNPVTFRLQDLGFVKTTGQVQMVKKIDQ